MRKPSALPRHANALALTALALSTAACAGPRVGDVVGAPSTTTMTVQAKVVSATPVIGQVAVPRQVCYDELRQNPPRSSGAGAVMGAIAGGVIGNSVGKGAGKALATGLGIFGGAIAGDHIENDGRQGTTSSVRRCDQQAEYENRVMAYNVVYEFAGQRFNTQMGQEPGATIPVQVSLTPAVAPAPVMAPAVYAPTPEPVYEEPYEPGWRRHRRWD
ncbi:MAG: hypothetical protein EPO09_09270 [Aquabacterium sp.]|uniref:glycine zipper 2TM domain-containing protein n=1 Tax=Aquabacterium sp. TaxID=1872578 RepID=UPI00121E51E0|nr:hypothetical protein [Aquabacterium sp.]TAK94635.1 MAG: hypothetical protein EPO09_09270 [Aquabacterium sp.]